MVPDFESDLSSVGGPPVILIFANTNSAPIRPISANISGGILWYGFLPPGMIVPKTRRVVPWGS